MSQQWKTHEEALKIEEQLGKELKDKNPNLPVIPPLSQFILARTDRDYKLVNIKVDLFDKLFQNDVDFYINKGGTNAIYDRYNKFGDFLRMGKPIEASLVFIDSSMDRASFTNGRHRYAYLRDMGMTVIPLAMNNESIKRARKLGLMA